MVDEGKGGREKLDLMPEGGGGVGCAWAKCRWRDWMAGSTWWFRGQGDRERSACMAEEKGRQ